MFRRRGATCFAFGFALAVAALDVTAPAPYRSWGYYGWAAFVTAVVFVGVTAVNWRKHKAFVLPGVLRLREAVFFIAAVAAAASVTVRATAALPLPYTFTTLPGWPSFYLLLFLVIVGVGAYFWFTGRDLRPWLLFALLTVGAANGQLLNLAAGGYAVFFGFAAAVYFYQAETSGPAKPRVSYMEGAVLIFVGVAMVGGLWSQDWGGSFRSVYFLSAGVLVFLIFARELESADILVLPPAAVWAILVTQIAFEAALVAKFVLVGRWISLNVPQENLFWTMGVSRNALSTYFVAALPLLILAERGARRPAPSWLLRSQIVMAAALPVLSLSKSGILGVFVVLAVAATFWGTESRMNLKLVTAGAILGVALVLAGVFLFLPGGATRFLNPLTYTSRLLMFRVVFAAVRDYPLTGVGLGAAGAWVAQAHVLSPEELASVPEFLTGHSHSLFLEVLGTMGIFGLLALLVMFQTGAWAAAKLTKMAADRFFFGMVTASVAGAAAVLTFALGLALLSPVPLILFVGLGCFEGGLRRRGIAAPAPGWSNTLFAALVICGTGAGLMQAASAYERARGEAEVGRGDFRAAAVHFERAGRLAFWDAAPRERLAQARLNAGDVAGARAAEAAALSRARGNAARYERVGLLHWALGEEKNARYFLRRAVDLDPAGLAGGFHHTYYALYLAAHGRPAEARAALTAAVGLDPWLCRDAAFVASGPDDALRTYLRAPAPAELQTLLFIRLGRAGFGPQLLPRRVAPAGRGRSYYPGVCLEDIYLRTFQREFALRPVEYGIAPRSIYLVGEGYAETRLRAQTMFTDLAAGVFIRPDDPDVAQALLASRHRDLERHRWEVEGLLGMALLAERAGNASAVPTILREFRVKSVAVRRGVAGYGETAAAKIRRLRYYHVMDEQPDWDLELADALASTGDATGARYYYERAAKVLLAADAEAGDARLDAAVRGALRCDALAAAAGGNRLYGGGRLFFPVTTPASYAAAATVDEFYGNYKPALLRLRAGVYRYPRDVPLALRLASFYARRGLPAKEKEALNAPGVRDDIRVRYARAAVAAREGDRAGARALAGDLERDMPGDILPYLMSAQTERDVGAYDAALAALERARENIPPGSLWASRYAAVIRAEGGDAGPYFDRARRLNPFDAEPYIVDADDLLHQGKAAEGISLLRRAVDADPASSWAWLSLADGYRRLDRDGDVRRAFEAALVYDGVGSAIALAYDDYLKNRGDKRARERVLTAAIRRDPTNAALRLRLGEIRLAAGDFERGIQLLRMAVALEPTDAGANAALGYSYLNAGKPAKAIPCLETARSAVPGPEGDNYRVLLADAYIEVGRNEDALRELDAVTQADKLAKAFYLRAKAYFNMGRPEDAAAAAARALALDPSLTEARGFIP